MYTGSKKSVAASVGASVTSAPLLHSRNTACRARGTRGTWGPTPPADARRVEDMEEFAFRPSLDVARLGGGRGVESMGVFGGSLSVFGDFTGVENMEASAVFRGAETVGEYTAGRSPRRRLGDLRGEEAMTLGHFWRLENTFMLESC
jgi:hypothetical protein